MSNHCCASICRRPLRVNLRKALPSVNEKGAGDVDFSGFRGEVVAQLKWV